MRFPIPSLPGAAVLVALGIVVATAGIIALANGPVPNVRVTVSVPSNGRLPSGGLTSLLVTLSPSTAAEPRFFIVEGRIVYAWNTTGVTASTGSGPQPIESRRRVQTVRSPRERSSSCECTMCSRGAIRSRQRCARELWLQGERRSRIEEAIDTPGIRRPGIEDQGRIIEWVFREIRRLGGERVRKPRRVL